MTVKALGAGALFVGALLLRARLLSGGRERSAALWQLAQALSYLSCEIGTVRTPLPRLLKTRGFGYWGDSFFSSVHELVFASGRPLAEGWRISAAALPLNAREKEELAALGTQFSAPAAELAEKLGSCAQTLHEAFRQAEAERVGNEKLVTPLCLCAGVLLAILLA